MTFHVMARRNTWTRLMGVAMLSAAWIPPAVHANQILETTGFTDCNESTNITVQRVKIQYDNEKKEVTFDVAGTSHALQNVTAVLDVKAYGREIYSKTFDPCSEGTHVAQLCPVPEGTFAARGTQKIPQEYSDKIPGIAFSVPDISALATLQLLSKDGGKRVACIESQVSNGKTTAVPAVSYVAAGIAGAAMVMTGATAVTAALSGGASAGVGTGAGAGTMSPSFSEVFGVFQGFAMNGMMSVNYPQVYRSFSKNFAFSTALVSWTQLQVAIDDFRDKTGGNLTGDSVQFLRNATLQFSDGSTDILDRRELSGSDQVKRAFGHFVHLALREISKSVNATASGDDENGGVEASIRKTVHGIQAYANELSIPSANTFMTVLLIVAIVIAAIAVSLLLFKVVLEFWALFGSFPKSLTGFRKHYWGSIARAVTSLILLLYGVWVLYCIFQFTNGDSWAAKTLAGVTLALFTGILALFSYKIYTTAKKLKDTEGDASGLYDHKSLWVKYSIFYESYRKDYWWAFVPTIVYMFAKGCCLAAADGHGMAQTIAQIAIELAMLTMLLWSRPYERRSSNVINVCIQVVRVLSVGCILVFVEELAFEQTTQTVTGVVLIAVQSALTGVLSILICWNAIIACCKANPHRQRRKDLEKLRDMDTLTPLEARDSVHIDRKVSPTTSHGATDKHSVTKGLDPLSRDASPDRYIPAAAAAPAVYHSHRKSPSIGSNASYRPLTPLVPMGPDHSSENLVLSAAPLAGRQPTLPNVGRGHVEPFEQTRKYIATYGAYNTYEAGGAYRG